MRFDVRKVNLFEWAGIGAAVVALAVLWAPWWAFTDQQRGLVASGSYPPGWEREWLAQVSVFLLVAGAVVALLPHLGVRVPWRSGIWIGTAVLAVVCIAVSRQPLGASGMCYCGPARTLWYYLAVGATWVSALAALLNARSASGSVS